MASNNFSLIFSLLIISVVLCSTTTDAFMYFHGIETNLAKKSEHNQRTHLVGTPPPLYKVAGRRGLPTAPPPPA
nr:uncharacterized protein LOC109161108 [Ipomoea batatas]